MSDELMKIGRDLLQQGGKPAVGGIGGLAVGAAIAGPVGAAAAGILGIIGGLFVHCRTK